MMPGDFPRLFLRRTLTVISAEVFLMSFIQRAAQAQAAQATASQTAGPTVTLFSGAKNGILNADKSTVYVKLFSWTGNAENYEVKVRATDWNGAEIYKHDFKVNFSGNWSAPIELSLNRYGPYNVTANLYKAGQTQPLRTETARLLRVVPVPKLSAEQRHDSWIGANTHAAAPWQSLAAVGIHWARDYSWGWLGQGETAPMASNGISFAPTMQAATEAGVSILPVMQRILYKPDRSGYTSDLALVTASYERLGKAFPLIEYWELDNEPEFTFVGGKIDLENYRPFIKAAATGLQKAGKAKVVLAGTAGIRIADTQSLVKTEGVSLPVRDDFQATSYHYYTGGLPVEIAQSNTNETGGQTSGIGTLLDSQRSLNRAAHSGGRESWLTEIGWDVTNGSAVGEHLQAVYLPRVFLLSRWVGTDKVFWYFDRDVEGSKEKYSTMGLFDLQGIARPSAAALAALSQQTALTKLAGSIDLGEDRWCIALRKPGGGYVLGAWTVKGEYPLPEELSSATAFDLFGNPSKPKKLTSEVTYFHRETLPAAWQAHLQTELESPTIMQLAKGGTTDVQIQAPKGEGTWVSLAKGLTASPWKRQGRMLTSQIQAAPGIDAGKLEIVAGVTGNNWQRHWSLTAEIGQPTTLKVGPYIPGKDLTGEIQGAISQTQAMQLSVPAGTGKVTPASGEVSGGNASQFTLTPDAAAKGPIPLSIRLANGAEQIEWIRPFILDVPQSDKPQISGRFDAAMEKNHYDSRYFASSIPDFQPEAALSWSTEGLRVAIRLPIDPAAPTNPMNFWDWTNFEVFIDTSDGPSTGFGPKAHQFYFVPVKEGANWRLVAGEFKRSAVIDKTTFDDKRLQTAVRVEAGHVVMEALIPASALGGSPQAGKNWCAAIGTNALTTMGLKMNATWPAPKENGLLKGSENWGTLRFVNP
jgi:hypothetical protein